MSLPVPVSDAGTGSVDVLDMYYRDMGAELECLRERERSHEATMQHEREGYESRVSSLSQTLSEARARIDSLLQKASESDDAWDVRQQQMQAHIDELKTKLSLARAAASKRTKKRERETRGERLGKRERRKERGPEGPRPPQSKRATPKGPKDKWHGMYARLRQYLGTHETWPKDSQGTLCRWLTFQRASYRRGELDSDRVAALEDIGMDWEPTKTESQWKESLQELQAYVDLHGTVPEARKKRGGDREAAGEETDDYEARLFDWIEDQKDRQRQGDLSKSQKEALERLGVEFETLRLKVKSRVVNWETRMDELRDYLSVHKTWPPKREVALFRWVDRQRCNRRAGKLKPDRVSALEQLGIEWDPRVRILTESKNGFKPKKRQ
ncbi:hypothetical protein KIPB_008466 [Kipferlia bialata]|uniref:Helicase-associated domain-containing protein n=1 Tax=Kipferlia bialata TaxID=797122 RepID=A0A9K3D1Y7_9EUKA|nr:hypothetical protein KIPB_008466 [Kipferlia bialata]|eukprot:g8466.t1